MRPQPTSPPTTVLRRGRAAFGALLVGAALLGTVGAFAPAASASPADGFPFGSHDVAWATSDGVFVAGWAIDPDGAPVTDVHVYIDGAPVAALHADQPRPDVGASFPAYGPNHGFSATLSTGRGTHSVCVFGINNGGAGGHVFFGCRTVQVGRSPFGTVDFTVPSPGGVTLMGWAQDPDTRNSIVLHAYVNGTLVAAGQANLERPDVAAVYGNGSAHGFNMAVPVPLGTHQVCLYAIDGTSDANALVDCGQVTRTGNPIAAYGRPERAGPNVRLTGWAIDPDTTAPVQLHVYVNELVTVLDANQPRPDVAAVYPAYGPNHGFDGLVIVPASAVGGGTTCVYVLNAPGTPGDNVGGCSEFGPQPAA